VGFNFVGGDLDQGFLLPPDMREWLDPDDLAFFVSDAVAQFDLAEFTASYRRDGRGGAAYDPEMMVALLLFAYCEGVKSSRQIERRCRRDVAYRVLSRNQQPDHATIARFRDRHRAALRAVFVQVLRLCAEAGLVRVGLVALDGTKLRADASGLKNYDIDRAVTAIGQVEKQIEELLTAAARTDAAEDAAEQDKHDDPPAQLRQRQHRLAALRAAKDRLAAQAGEVQRVQDQRRADYDAARGKRGVRPAVKPTERALAAARRTNLTDPDSRVMHIAGGLMQSFNAQAVVTSGQIVVAAEVVPQAVDYDAFHPMLDAARVALDQAGVNEPIRAVVADAGYSSKNNRDHVRAPSDRPIALVAVPTLGGNKQPDCQDRPDPRFSKDRAFDRAARRITNPAGRRLYARRKIIIEPVFGQMKQRSGPRVQHRGRDKVNTEWKMMAAAHNLLKCWRHLRTVQPAH
jgi:transposase